MDRRAALLCGLLWTACSDRPVGDGESTTGSSGPGGAPTTTESDETTSSNLASTGDASGCGETSGMTDGVACPEECSLAAAVCRLEIGEFEDCGTVDLGDDAASWQAVHDCALAAVSERQTFVAITQHFTYDSTSYQAHVGQAGCSYEISEVTFDDDPCGGEGCDPTVWKQACAGLSLSSGCIGVPGEICLQCDGPGEGFEMCGLSGG